MALLDLSNYDILELLCTSFMSDDQKGKYIYDYMDAFSEYLSAAVADKFTDEDEEKLELLLLDPATNPEIVEKYYKEKIPNYDAFLLAGTLRFKKEFLLDFYRGMLEETTKQNDETVHFWVKIVAAAEEDNWDQVSTLVKTVSENFLKEDTSPDTAKTVNP